MGGFRMNLADYDFSHAIKDANRDDFITSDKEKRPYLGLPLTYATYRATLKGENFDRKGSWLIFGVYEINGNFVPRILIFKSIFLPNFRGNFVVDKKIGQEKITLNAYLTNSNIYNKIIRDCYENLKTSNWQVVWGAIK